MTESAAARERASPPVEGAPAAGRGAVGGPRRLYAVVGLLVLQALCAAFFVGDALADLIFGDLGEPPDGDDGHLGIEMLAAVALVASVAFTATEVRRLLLRQRLMEEQLRAASGAFLEVVEAHFDDWRLTPSERDVAMLALKGFQIAEIARIRETRTGTVKAQLGAIYAKAGVSGRPQLISLFVEVLLGDGIGPPEPEPHHRSASGPATAD